MFINPKLCPFFQGGLSMSVSAEKLAIATNPAPTNAAAANTAPVTEPKPVGDMKTSSDKPSTTPTPSQDLTPGDLKERLAAVVEEATRANSDGRATVGNLFSALKLGRYSVDACDLAVVLLDNILKSLDKNSFIYQELNSVQTSAKACDAQANAAVAAINLVAGAALSALVEGDTALAELVAIYNSLPPNPAQKGQPKDALAELAANLKVNADTINKATVAQTSLQAQAATLDTLRQRLAGVVVEASKANNDGRVAVANLVVSQALGRYSVVACNQAVLLLDEILKTLNKSSKIYKDLYAVQNKAKDVNKKSNEAIVVINDLVIKASAALALGDGSLRELLAVSDSLKARYEAKPASTITFSSSATAAATASGGGAPDVQATPAATTKPESSCRIA
jgi:hypothetical protein